MKTLTLVFAFFDYLSQLYRGLGTSRPGLPYAFGTEPRLTLECLPDDVLLIVLDQLEQPVVENAVQAGFLIHGSSNVIRFSTVNKRIRVLGEARILRTLHLGPSWSAKKLSHALLHIRLSGGAKRYTKRIKIDLWLEGAIDSAKNQMAPMSELIETLPSLDHLRALGITATASSASALRSAFEDANMKLDNITELTLSPHMDWLLPRCPNLQALSINDWVVMSQDRSTHAANLLKAAAAMTDLLHFALHNHRNEVHLPDVLEALPNLHSLGLFTGTGGGINLDYHLPILRRFRQLKRLELVEASKFLGQHHMRTVSISRCHASKEDITAAQFHITHKVFQALPRLQELILGPNFRAWVVRGHEDSRIDVRWEATVFRRPLQERLGHLRERFSCGYSRQWETYAEAQSNEAAEQWSLADSMHSRTDAQTLADVQRHENDGGED
ncbi:hypothetical protein DOTSEDRAFT_74106 [Dothistroma septosporum NZE10]|uniref:F-box domain-containing protein n=1 Tax=Dothistroma septosporum (strain NZE10 / CBS 128990) TaxID=675120 RepID=N1PFP4_DOTSN|nr:hypothetical protein DOTSEDRAFT_74106 [Dothistroma septosporum NZE10]